MKKIILSSLVAAAAIAAPAVVRADDGVAFNVGVVTDYRYRGISQTRLKPALQGGIDYTKGAFYLGTWASTINWIKDAGGKSNVELDLYGGYKAEVAKDVTLDVGVLRYQYNSNNLNPSANTTELYAAVTAGPATVKYSSSVSNLFGFASSKASGYLDVSASWEVVDGWSIAPHVGWQTVTHTNDAAYIDYSVTVSKDFKGVLLSVAAVGTDSKFYVSPSSKNLGKASLVLGAKYSF